MHNPKLADKLGISKVSRDEIDQIHSKLYDICVNHHKYDDPVGLIEQYEFELQELWGFTPSRDFHSWWIKVDGCTCPILDNKDHFGSPHRVINDNCPWHGG